MSNEKRVTNKLTLFSVKNIWTLKLLLKLRQIFVCSLLLFQSQFSISMWSSLSFESQNSCKKYFTLFSGFICRTWLRLTCDSPLLIIIPCAIKVIIMKRLLHFVGDKAKGWISKRVFQENKARQIFRKMFVFREIWRALFSWNIRFEIRPFALLPTTLEAAAQRYL